MSCCASFPTRRAYHTPAWGWSAVSACSEEVARYTRGVTSDEPAVKPKPERPRDELGRPLPKGSPNRLQLEDFEALSLDENRRLAVRYFDEGQFFGAHEAWEACWNQTKGAADEEFFKGLSQLGASYTHYRRGNAQGAQMLMRRGLGRIGPYGPRHRGLDVAALVAAAADHAQRMAAAAHAGEAPPPISPPRLGPILEG